MYTNLYQFQKIHLKIILIRSKKTCKSIDKEKVGEKNIRLFKLPV
jgi:hypothetical protein